MLNPHAGSNIGSESEALGMVVRGVPVSRTLDALTIMVSRVRPDARCAILLLDDDHISIAAEHGLRPEDRNLIRQVGTLEGTAAVAEFTALYPVKLKPLITQSAELIGWVALFGADGETDTALEREIEEVCWIATLAIEQKHLLEEIAYRAHHDPLTQLWNRMWMEEEIERALTEAPAADRLVGLAQIGLDGFRVINDVLGHQVGNELLRQIAVRLSASLPPGHSLARGSGDEFMILMPAIEYSERLTAASQRLLDCFEEGFQIGDHELVVRATIGSTVVSAGNCTAAELQSQSSIALRYAKKKARGRIVAFEPSMVTVPPERLVMEQHLRFALQKREFQIYCQPQIELATGRLVGVETLLRWNHPWLGFISPGTFIPIAEELCIIEEIGDWALDESMRFLNEWRTAGLGPLRLGVNVSATQFSRPDFGSSVARRLRLARIAPEELELEITEGVVMTNFEHGLRQLKILRGLGVAIAIDDFGTGHSSLAYLQQLPIQRLKIDRMFVREIVSADERPPLLASIIQMCHALGLAVIAEGVETTEQALALTALDCEEVQGFLISKPLPTDAFIQWAKDRILRERTVGITV